MMDDSIFLLQPYILEILNMWQKAGLSFEKLSTSVNARLAEEQCALEKSKLQPKLANAIFPFQ